MCIYIGVSICLRVPVCGWLKEKTKTKHVEPQPSGRAATRTCMLNSGSSGFASSFQA